MAQPILSPQSQVDNRRSFIGRWFWLAATLLLVVGAVSWSQAATGAVEIDYKVTDHGVALLLPDEVGQTYGTNHGQFRQGDGAPVALYSVGYAVEPAAPEAMARQYLTENAARLHLSDTGLSGLRHHATRASLTGLTVRFRQYQGNVPVYKGEVVVHINNANEVSFVTSNYRPVPADLNTTPTLTAAAARQIASDHIGSDGPFDYDVTSPTVYNIPGLVRLAYQVRLDTNAPAGRWEIIVDAHSGELLKVHDDAFYNVTRPVNTDSGDNRGGTSVVDGTAFVFDPDPLTSATAVYNDPGFTDGNDATTTQLDGERFLVTLNDIQLDNSDSMHRLIGPWAENVDWASPFLGDFAQASSAFLNNRFDNVFEATTTYYHIDASMRYLNITLGLTIEPFAYTTGVRYDPHGFNGADNSSYSSGTQRLQFGEGGVDDAEDSDVIHHELGHGLHDWVTSGSLSQVNGLSEGTGDYWAQSYNRSIDSWTPADPQYNWVFRWDGHNPFWGGRITNYGPTYPGGLINQIHTDGQIWATCMMKVWDAIGKTKTDIAFWEGLGNTNSNTGQEAAANAVFNAAIDMNYDMADLVAMRNVMQTCGYDMDDLPLVYTEFVHLPAISQE